MCGSEKCPVHTRKDSREVDEAADYVALVSYVDSHAVITSDNSMVLAGMIMGLGDIPFMTIIVEVGDGVIGDKMLDDDITLDKSVYDVFFSKTIESAEDTHDMAVMGVEVGVLGNVDGATPITPSDALERYAKNLRGF